MRKSVCFSPQNSSLKEKPEHGIMSPQHTAANGKEVIPVPNVPELLVSQTKNAERRRILLLLLKLQSEGKTLSDAIATLEVEEEAEK